MSAARSRPEGTDPSARRDAPLVAPAPLRDGGKPAVARLADDSAEPVPSPVHHLQAGLAQLTSAEAVLAGKLYPGWFRLIFPVAASGGLWAVILWWAGIIG